MSGPAVLLVEDSGFMASHVSGTLEAAHGMDVRVAETADEARQRLRENDVDCLVVNTQLPDENGIDFVRSVEQSDDVPSMASLLFTGEFLEDIAAKAFEAGVVDVVSKEHHAGDSMVVFANRIKVAIDAFDHRHGD